MVIGISSALYNATVYPLAVVILATIVVILPTLISYEKRRITDSKEAA
jgi:hypothetical protein